ncbi:hypothetical protein PR202_ga12067 [Eleusine coracana subsp. coracana]|uniref:Transcriptional coactivator Hfi1/Transcriptional adapter 1 n=1 Tax=Eleusine coracana subsp. coracana TaxID=191504 RepID=A0AAV5CB65_ELECO|nr:hypothetical protein PR202_ga12067 [Eleusine coracana subsp. coracana]
MKQPPPKKLARVDTLEIKARLFKLVGNQRAELYFRCLGRFMGFQLGKEEFDKICEALLGKENIKLHNILIKAICKNVFTVAGPPPSKQAATGNSQTSTVSNGTLNGGVLAARRMRPVTTRERRFADKPSPLGKSPLGHPGPGEFVSTGSKAPQEVISVEDGEEVDQARGSPVCVQSRSPIRAPFGIATVQNSQPSTSCSLDVCYNSGELPDSQLLLRLLEDKLKDLGLTLPRESADILNSGLNVYISEMLKACLGVAKARGNKTRMYPPNGSSAAAVNSGKHHGIPVEAGCSYQASLLDLWTAVQSNDQLVGCRQQREKIVSHLLNR